jgi:hypothetical protein
MRDTQLGTEAFFRPNGGLQALWCNTRIGILDRPLERKLHEAHRP